MLAAHMAHTCLSVQMGLEFCYVIPYISQLMVLPAALLYLLVSPRLADCLPLSLVCFPSFDTAQLWTQALADAGRECKNAPLVYFSCLTQTCASVIEKAL